MKEGSAGRVYRMGARAEAAARTAEAIVDAMVGLWRERSLEEITLELLAARANVSVRTVIRRFGSRDGVVAAAIAREGGRISEDRSRVKVGDVDGALEVLLRHYERDGLPVLRTLGLEDRLAAARAVAEVGRAEHRAWCGRVFAPHLPPADSPARSERLDAFVAATDLYLWKLLRIDLGRSKESTREVMRMLIQGLLTERG